MSPSDKTDRASEAALERVLNMCYSCRPADISRPSNILPMTCP